MFVSGGSHEAYTIEHDASRMKDRASGTTPCLLLRTRTSLSMTYEASHGLHPAAAVSAR